MLLQFIINFLLQFCYYCYDLFFLSNCYSTFLLIIMHQKTLLFDDFDQEESCDDSLFIFNGTFLDEYEK